MGGPTYLVCPWPLVPVVVEVEGGDVEQVHRRTGDRGPEQNRLVGRITYVLDPGAAECGLTTKNTCHQK